jgi:hypothetical protein
MQHIQQWSVRIFDPRHLSRPPVFSGGVIVFCRSMFVFLSVFLWSLYVCTFFDQRDLITPLVSSTLSYKPRRAWRYQSGNQNPYIEEEQTTQWPKSNTNHTKNRGWTQVLRIKYYYRPLLYITILRGPNLPTQWNESNSKSNHNIIKTEEKLIPLTFLAWIVN